MYADRGIYGICPVTRSDASNRQPCVMRYRLPRTMNIQTLYCKKSSLQLRIEHVFANWGAMA
eukprot:6194664-Pleurochrysis_carterae.AAC.3